MAVMKTAMRTVEPHMPLPTYFSVSASAVGDDTCVSGPKIWMIHAKVGFLSLTWGQGYEVLLLL